MFSTSTQLGHWMYGSVDEVSRLRQEANLAFTERHQKMRNVRDTDVSRFFLNYDEEKMLLMFYQNVLREFCKSFQPPMPRSVVGTAFHYYKRFYLNNSVMDYHPKFILVTCIYLACKVDEFNVSMDQFVANVKGDREKARAVILNNELLLMQQLKYHLTIHNPYRPVEGFLIDLKTRCQDAGDPDRFRPDIDDLMEKTFFTDACLIFSPSQIALGVVIFAAAKQGTDIDVFVSKVLLSGDVEKEQLLNTMREYLWKLIQEIPDLPDKNTVKRIEKKLEGCRNQAFNPDSQEYKRALREEMDAEDGAPVRKSIKLEEDVKKIDLMDNAASE